jgi:hypothetical protein
LGSRFDSLFARIGETASDDQEALATTAANMTAGVQAAIRDIRDDHGPHGTITVTGEGHLPEPESRPGTQVGEATTAVLYSAIAVAAIVKSIRSHLSKRHEEEHEVEPEK